MTAATTRIRARKQHAEKRWQVVVDFGSGKHVHDIEELEELHDLIEGGPDWNLIAKITITLNR